METLPGSPKYMNIKRSDKSFAGQRGFWILPCTPHIFNYQVKKKRKEEEAFPPISTKRIREKMGYTN